MNKYLTIGLLLLSLSGISQTYTEHHGVLRVSGNKIVNQHNTPISFAGPSLFWNNWSSEFYNSNLVHSVATDWNAPIIRASMGVEADGGYITNPSAQLDIETVINAAIQEGIYVIVDWHSHQAEDYETEAIEFFTDMAEKYGDKPNIIYELYNEPNNEPIFSTWRNHIKPYAESVINEIRKIDPDNLIIVGTPNWSQDVDDAADDPIDDYANIAYTLHFYAATHKEWLREKAEYALKKGIALVVTEWGTVDALGQGEPDTVSVAQWVQFMQEYKLTHCNWSLFNKDEGSSMLIPSAGSTGNWTDSDLTASGKIAVDLIKNWEGNNVGIQPVSKNSTLTVSQTGANEYSIQSNSFQNNFSYSLYNVNGQILEQGSSIGEATITTNDIPNGLLLLKVSTETEQGIYKILK